MASVRVRFAPSPTGAMHLGNVRAALINYLFAHQHKGTFILRIEDTDPQRNVDPNGERIQADLAWLGLHYDEGPVVGGPYAPYQQSQRSDIYEKYLTRLAEENHVYRCFCTTEELEKKRQRQIALKMPPRYDRTCAGLSEADIQQKLSTGIPFIWRFKLGNGTLEVKDLARGVISYDLHHFSDFPLTRQDGTFTFIFANAIDDFVMKITHVFRGEEHISNTAHQAALYQALNAPIPVFWHTPIICSANGRKLSKRDFGFSLNDLRNSGFLPQALVNYLAIIGCGGFTQEIMSLEELAVTINFEEVASAGAIRYDLEKLRWINHKWIGKLSVEELAQYCFPLIQLAYPQASSLTIAALASLLKPVQQELVLITDCVEALRCYFEQPVLNTDLVKEYNLALHIPILEQVLTAPTSALMLETMKKLCKENNIPLKDFFTIIRIALTGKPQGPGINELMTSLSHDEVVNRLRIFIQSVR